MHLAGNPAANDRNGTYDYLNVCPDGTVVIQDVNMANVLRSNYRHSTIWTDIHDNASIYDYGDIMVLPRKYGGNCLPLNEALSRGMPVIMTDVEPNSTFLPKEWLVPARSTGTFAPRFPIDIYEADYDALREKITWFQNCDMAAESRKADALAESISWTTMLPKWQKAIESVL